jgi:hypothetical protein
LKGRATLLLTLQRRPAQLRPSVFDCFSTLIYSAGYLSRRSGTCRAFRVPVAPFRVPVAPFRVLSRRSGYLSRRSGYFARSGYLSRVPGTCDVVPGTCDVVRVPAAGAYLSTCGPRLTANALARAVDPFDIVQLRLSRSAEIQK